MNYNFANFKHISVAVKKSSACRKKNRFAYLHLHKCKQHPHSCTHTQVLTLTHTHNLHTINLVTSREKDVTYKEEVGEK